MKNRGKMIVLAAVAVCVLIALGVLANEWIGNSRARGVTATQATVTVQDGVPSPAGFSQELSVEKDGLYRLKVEWNAQPGLITGARLLDTENRVLFAATGEALRSESEPLQLEQGRYTLEYVALTTPDAIVEFAQSYRKEDAAEDAYGVRDASGKMSSITEYPFLRECRWTNTYTASLSEEWMHTAGTALGVIVGAGVGLILAFVILRLRITDRAPRAKYDERQQAARGRGYRAGFWTAVGYFAVAAMLDILEIPLPMENSVVILLGIFIGISVMAIVCIFTDAFFALNESRKSWGISTVLLGLCNLGFGVISIVNGDAVQNGMLTFRCANLLCGLFMVAIGVALLIRRLTAEKGGDED